MLAEVAGHTVVHCLQEHLLLPGMLPLSILMPDGSCSTGFTSALLDSISTLRTNTSLQHAEHSRNVWPGLSLHNPDQV